MAKPYGTSVKYSFKPLLLWDTTFGTIIRLNS